MYFPSPRPITIEELRQLASVSSYTLVPPHEMRDAFIDQIDNVVYQELTLPPSLRALVAPLFDITPSKVVAEHVGMFIAACDAKHVVPVQANHTELPPVLAVLLKVATPVYHRLLALRTPPQVDPAHSTTQRILETHKPILPPPNQPVEPIPIFPNTVQRSRLYIRIKAPVYQHYLTAYHAYKLLPPTRPPTNNARVAYAIDATFSTPPLIPSQQEVPQL
jgi:hypothetical protein